MLTSSVALIWTKVTEKNIGLAKKSIWTFHKLLWKNPNKVFGQPKSWRRELQASTDVVTGLKTDLKDSNPEFQDVISNTFSNSLSVVLFDWILFAVCPTFLLIWIFRTQLFSQFSSVTQSCPTLRPHGPQHARLPCHHQLQELAQTHVHQVGWCHPTILSSVVPFSSCLQSFPASGSFQMSQFFASDGQSIGIWASASVLPMNTQDWSPLGLSGLISLQSKGLSRDISNSTVQSSIELSPA